MPKKSDTQNLLSEKSLKMTSSLSKRTQEEWCDALRSFVLEKHPFALFLLDEMSLQIKVEKNKNTASTCALGLKALQKWTQASFSFLEKRLLQSVKNTSAAQLPNQEPTPTVDAKTRLYQAHQLFLDDVKGFFERAEIAVSITNAERKWILEGLLLTRATDNRMKQMFLSSELKYGDKGFQGKGFRSLGQEAIYAAALRLKRGEKFLKNGVWQGDVAAPLIRDLGLALAFTDDPSICLNGQAGKSGPPLGGKDLHMGDLSKGILPAAAPLTIASCTVVGFGASMAMADDGSKKTAKKSAEHKRVAFSFIGEGGSSLGEWHESINMAAAASWPVVFCLQNNQTALSTPTNQQSSARTFADKAAGYGILGLTIDGTDPEAIAAAFTWAADRARKGLGPCLIELVAMRMCGHAHHDDMMYLGSDPKLSMRISTEAPKRGYVHKEKYEYWAKKDPVATYISQLLKTKVVTEKEVEALEEKVIQRCDAAMEEIKRRPWPKSELAGKGVFNDDDALVHDLSACPKLSETITERQISFAAEFNKEGSTYLEAIGRSLKNILDDDDQAFVIGEDVGAPYGNAFLLTKEVCEAHPTRVLNAPIAEGGIIGTCVGAALDGKRPLGEMQFNDFAASGFNELVNNAAKMHYRTGAKVPMVMRMPWGGLRRAGPYHSQDTSPWFRRSFGLKIVAPSSPQDAYSLLKSAHQDDNPVLFYEHIGLYREPSIKQILNTDAPPLAIGKAAFRKLGDDVTLISYGAFVWRTLAVAKKLEQEGVGCDVIDLRSLSPVDFSAISASVKHTGKVLLVGEDSKTGSVLESIGARISESLFEHLDGPVRILGALDTPVPYAPSLEDEFLLDENKILTAARAVLAW